MPSLLTQHFPRWLWIVLASILLAILAEISGGLFKLEWLSNLSPHLQVLLLITAIVCLILAFHDKNPPSLRSGEGVRGWGLLITIFLFALAIRLWHNGDAIRVLVDEMNFVSGMTNFWKPQPLGILTPMDNISPFTWLFAYGQANTVWLFGRSMSAIRAFSALVGALNIPALYLLAAALFNRKIALTAAFLLAVFPPHIHFSRIALLSITDPLFGTLTLAFLARGMKHQRPLDFALAGISLGLTQYFFEGGRLLFIPLAAAWLIACTLFRPRQNSTSQHSEPSTQHFSLRSIFYFALCTILIAAPVYYTILATGKPLVGRMNASGLGGGFWEQILASPIQGSLDYLTQHLAPALGIYIVLPDQSPYYGGDTALLLFPLVPFFLIGLWVALRRWRSPGHMLILLWLLTTSLGNTLLQVSAATTRYVVVFPAIALTTALGLIAALDWIAHRITNKPISDASTPHFSLFSLITRHSLLITALALAALIQLAYYFGPHLSSFDARFRETRPTHDIEDVVYRALDFPPHTHVYIISPGTFDLSYGPKFAAFFRDDLPTVSSLSRDLTAEWLSSLPRNVDQAFFIEAADTQTLLLLQAAFNSALEGPFFSPYNVSLERQFVLFYVRRLP
jgi:hypothetical protein